MRPTVYCSGDGDLQQVPIDLVTAGDHVVVPGIVDRIIKVHRVKMTSLHLLGVSFKSGDTILSGPEFLFGQLLDLDMEHPWYIVAEGEDFVLNLSDDVQLGGTIWYSQPAIQIT